MNENGQVLTLETDSSIDELLCRLVAEQRRELQDDSFQPVRFDSRKALLAEFKVSNRFRQIYDEAFEYYLVPHTDEEIEEYEHRLAGGLFQDLAYSYLSGTQPQSRVLLSPKKTLEFYEKLTGAKRVEHTLGLDSLDSSNPDGLIVEEHGGGIRIVAVCEYTLSGYVLGFENKYGGFAIGKKKRPGVFTDAQLLFVVPKETNMPIVHNNVETEEMPFTHGQFRNFVNGVFNYYKSHLGRSATLYETQKMVRG
ncbi:MAG: hypothetical protein QQN41_09495 [Nitrosopumilus sp.]